MPCSHQYNAELGSRDAVVVYDSWRVVGIKVVVDGWRGDRRVAGISKLYVGL